MSKFVLVNIKTKAPIKTDLSYISGSTIRGAYINLYINKNKIKEDISLNENYRRKLLSDSIRFFDAYPKIDGNYSIPTPLCFYATKNEIKKFSRDKKSIDIINEFKNNIEEGCQRVNKSEFSIIKDKKINLISVKRIENLHNCKKMEKENIFRYEAIDKGQGFYTIIQCEDDLADEVANLIDENILYIGGSKSSGYGRCEVSVEGIFNYNEIKSKYEIGQENNNILNGYKKLNIFFMSDAIVKDEFGNLQSTILDSLIEKKLGIKIIKEVCGKTVDEKGNNLYKASIISKDVKGYNAMWKTKVGSETAIKAGSVITYSYEGELDKEKIRQFEIDAIGSRKNEGYGRILINPNFDVEKCDIYKQKEVQRECVDLNKTSKNLMKNMLSSIVKEREEEYLTNIVVESLDGFAKESKLKKIKLKDSQKIKFPNTQKGKIITVMKDALDILKEQGEDASKRKVEEFKNGLKTKTKNLYQNRSRYNLFDFSIKDYLAEIITDKTIEEITGTDLEGVRYPNVKGVDYYKSSDYEMKLRLTKIIMEYKIREDAKQKNEKKGGNK